MVGACARPASVSPPPRPGRCTSARPWSPSRTPWPRAGSAASCCCASTTPTPSARSRGPSRASSTTSPGSGSSSRARPCARASGAALHVAAAAASCWPPRTPIAASARPRRSATTGAAARSRAPRPSAGTRPASRTSSASASPAPRSSWRTPRAAPCASPATRSPTSCSCARDGRPTFDLATSVDDRDLEITHIVRGEDHLANSARHLLLLRALGAVEPVFAHCPIIVGADGERLSTRRGAEPLAALRARGVPPEAVVAYAAQLACPAQGGASEVAPFAELAGRFSLARLGRGTAHADPAHLEWLGREVLAQPPGRASSRAGWRRSCPRARRRSVLEALAEAARGASALGEVADSAIALAQRPPDRPPASLRSSSSASCARPMSASSCPTRRPSSSSTRLRAARHDPRPLGPRRATPSENRPHGRAARPAAPGRGRGAAA